MTKSLHPALWYALVASVVVAALALSFALFPWHVLRGPLASYASHELQRDVTIGDLDVAFGRVTRVRLDDVSIGNAAWSVDQPMAHTASMLLFFSPWSLLKGEPDYIQLVRPEVLL